MITAMLFAGGKGARMKSVDLPKQFLEVGGKPIIIHTMEHFAYHPQVDHIVVACKEDWIDYLEELIEKFNVPKVKSIVPGGANGFDSIHNGVVATHDFSRDPEDIIQIRAVDGARYTVPSTIDPDRMDDLLTVRFRVANVFKNSFVSVYLNDERIMHMRKRIMSPGEMEQVILQKKKLQEKEDLKTITIRIEAE